MIVRGIQANKDRWIAHSQKGREGVSRVCVRVDADAIVGRKVHQVLVIGEGKSRF